jgi:hypothetical protein
MGGKMEELVAKSEK